LSYLTLVILLVCAGVWLFGMAIRGAHGQDRMSKMMCEFALQGIVPDQPGCWGKDDARPVVWLGRAYFHLAFVSRCWKVREGFEQVYINDLQNRRADEMVKAVQKKLGTLNDENFKVVETQLAQSQVFALISNPDPNVMVRGTGATTFAICQNHYQALVNVHDEVMGRP
jgi:hypothetical protein